MSVELLTLCRQGRLEEVVAYHNRKTSWYSGLFSWSGPSKMELWQQATVASCANTQHGVAILCYLQDNKLTDLHYIDKDGNSLLHHAVGFDNLPVVKYLIEIVNPNLMNLSAKTIVDLLTSNPKSAAMVDFICLYPAVVIE